MSSKTLKQDRTIKVQNIPQEKKFEESGAQPKNYFVQQNDPNANSGNESNIQKFKDNGSVESNNGVNKAQVSARLKEQSTLSSNKIIEIIELPKQTVSNQTGSIPQEAEEQNLENLSQEGDQEE